MATTTTSTSTITVLRTSQRGALLITDGVRVAWVQGRTHRADGSFTPSALTALAQGKTTEEFKTEQREREAGWRRAQEEGKKPIIIPIPRDRGKSRVEDFSEKAWRVKSEQWVRGYYGNAVRDNKFLPKSLVEYAQGEGCDYLTMPKWFYLKGENRYWLAELARITDPSWGYEEQPAEE